jgi:hypothetical protein
MIGYPYIRIYGPLNPIPIFLFLKGKNTMATTIKAAQSTIRIAKVKTSLKTKKQPKSKVVGEGVGRTTGLSVHAWWGYILCRNENEKFHLTDEELSKEFFNEFPIRTTHQPVKRFRSWYNNGTYNSAGTAPNGLKILDGVKPAIKSLEYVIQASPSITEAQQEITKPTKNPAE